MINKPVFEAELIQGMHNQLVKQASDNSADLNKAIDCLNSAIDILEDAGLTAQANLVLDILVKIANKNNDPHTRGLTPEKMVKNLLDHGTEFNMTDDAGADDLLNLEVGDNELEVSEKMPTEMDFEDEI